MAKSREVSSFEKITNDADFENFLEKPSLLILDVYQDRFGPCSISLHSTLERAKLALMDSSKIQLAVCDVDRIEKLERFRKRSIPTIVFCNRGRVVDIVYGANIPLIKKAIARQLLYEEKNSEERVFYEFDEPLPFEVDEILRKQAIKEAAEKAERDKAEADRLQLYDTVIRLMGESAPEAGVIFFMPHVMDSALKKTADVSRRLGLVTRGRKLVKITPEILEMLNYQLENPIDEKTWIYLENKDILVVLWMADHSAVAHEELSRYVEIVTELSPVVIEDENGDPKTVELKLLEPLMVYLDKKDRSRYSIAVPESRMSETDPTRSSSRFSQLSRASQSTQRSMKQGPLLKIPAVWTPANAAGNAMHCYVFFRNQFDSFLPSVAEPEPPHLCMVLPASYYADILDISAKKFPKELLEFGFFNGSRLSDMKLVCKDPKEYEDLKKKPEKIVLKVAERTEHFSLALMSMDVQYVSHNTKKGAIDCALVFDEAFYAKKEGKKK